MKFLIVFVSVIFLSLNPIFSQTIYYVSSSVGNDSNNGLSASTPFKTIEKVNELPLKPGDAVLFKRGDIWIGKSLRVINKGGEQNKRIIFGAFGNGNKPIITTKTELFGWRNDSKWILVGNNVWKIENKLKPNRMWFNDIEYPKAWYDNVLSSMFKWEPHDNYIYVYSERNPANSFSKIEISGEADINGKYTLLLRESDFITLENLDLRGGYTATIGLSGADNILIENCDIGKDANLRGIQGNILSFNNLIDLTSDNVVIKNCNIDSGWKLHTNYELYMDGISIQNGANYWEVFNNLVKNWGHTCIQINGYLAPANYHKIYLNEVTTKDLSYGRAFEIQGKDIGYADYNEVFNNYFYDTRAVSQIGGSYNKIYFNLIERVEKERVWEKVNDTWQVHVNGDRGIEIAPVSGGNIGVSNFNVIFNNTIVYTERASIHIWGKSKNNYFINNLIIQISANDLYPYRIRCSGGENTTWKNNLVYFENRSPTDLIVNYRGKGYSIEEFNKLSSNYGETISSNLFFNGDIKDLVLDYYNGDYSIIDGSLAQKNGADISAWLPQGFKDRNDILVDSQKPFIGALGIREKNNLVGLSEQIKVFLYGAYIGNSMDSKLARNGLIPLTQPYSSAPWNYNGNESVPEIRNDIVDWILLELRSDETTVTHRQAALLNRNGYVVGLDGSSNFYFNNIAEGDYYLVIYHRNHLPVMSAQKIHVAQNGAAEYDFTEEPSKIYGGKDAVVKFKDGYYGMIGGDTDANGVVNVLDNGAVQTNMFGKGYLPSDTDLNGIINVLDYSAISNNLLRTSKVP